MATLNAMFACLIIALMIGTSLSWVKGSSLKKRNTNGTRTQSQETDGVVRLVRNSDDDEDQDEDDNADEEDDDIAEGGRNVRNRAQNVLQVFLEIHNHNARNKKSNSKKFNNRSNERIITVYEDRRRKKNGSEKQEVFFRKVD